MKNINEQLRTLLLLSAFFAIELARAFCWAARTVDEPDLDGSLLRALVAVLINALSVVPRPVWRALQWVVWVGCVPVRTTFWVLGVGRENIRKRPPRPVTRWYAYTRARRARLRRRRRKEEDWE